MKDAHKAQDALSLRPIQEKTDQMKKHLRFKILGIAASTHGQKPVKFSRGYA
jgi:hypothetical protein